MTAEQTISAEFPYDSQFVTVHGSKMHFIDEGEGAPILFLHGNPTSSYLWRNIIPYLTPDARCIAPDLIGMGKSDRPGLDYRFNDHARYVDGFIEALELEHVTLVLHDWGSGLGFHYARRHAENVRALAFMEAIVRPSSWSGFPKDFKLGFQLMRTPIIGWFMISVMNVFVKQILPQAIVRKLSADEMAYYEAPYPTISSRKPVRQWPCEIPIDGKPADVYAMVTEYSNWLQETELPKLLCYASPGGLIDGATLAWCRKSFPNLETVDTGEGIHFIQEDTPDRIGQALAKWYRALER